MILSSIFHPFDILYLFDILPLRYCFRYFAFDILPVRYFAFDILPLRYSVFDILPLRNFVFRYFVLRYFAFDILSVDILLSIFRYFDNVRSIFCVRYFHSIFCVFDILLFSIMQYDILLIRYFAIRYLGDFILRFRYFAFRYFVMEAFEHPTPLRFLHSCSEKCSATFLKILGPGYQRSGHQVRSSDPTFEKLYNRVTATVVERKISNFQDLMYYQVPTTCISRIFLYR